MSSVASRLMLPSLISIAGIVFTQMWYMKVSKVTFVKAAGEPIAILQQHHDRVERRPTTRLIWQDVDQGDPLYPGESVRTTSLASGQIQFLKSGVTVGLEPDSVVVIEESDGKVALNLINGGVFVKSESTVPGSKDRSKSNVDQPLIKAGSKTISLADKKAELNLSVSDSGQANLVVSKGDVAISSAAGGAKEVVTAGNSAAIGTTSETPTPISIVAPAPNIILPISANAQTMIIQWKPIAATSTLVLEMGPTRDQMKQVGASLPGNLGKTITPIKQGGFFWRLVARGKNGKIAAESPTIYNQGLALEAPRLLSNAQGEHIFLSESDQDSVVKLSWSKPQGAELLTLQIAKDKEFKEIVENKSFPTTIEWSFPAKSTGSFYWRVSAAWNGISQSLTSVTGTFSLDRQKELPIPVAETPKNGTIFTKPEIEASGVVFAWTNIEGIPNYVATISQQQPDGSWRDIATTETKVPQFRYNKLTPGTWHWHVKSKNGSRLSKANADQSFKVMDVARIDTSEITKIPQIINSENTVNLKVSAIPANAARVRFKIADVNTKLELNPWLQGLLSGQLVAKIKTEGQYRLSVEALDKSDRLLAMSEPAIFNAKLPDRLPAPVLSAKTHAINAGENGSAEIQWRQVKGATSYVVELVGSKPLNYRVKQGTKITVPGLMPGTYKATVIAFDALGRPGAPSSELSVVVPKTSNLQGPKAKSIKVRD